MRKLVQCHLVPRGTDWKPFLDPMIAWWLLNPDDGACESAVALASKLDQPVDSTDLNFFQTAELELWCAWQCMDICYTSISKVGMVDVMRLEMMVVIVLAEMEVEGIGVDNTALANYREVALAELKKLENKAAEIAGTSFLLTSPSQVARILFEVLQLPVPAFLGQARSKTKTHISTSEPVLKQMTSVHPLPDIILRHRHVSKLVSTYLDIANSAVANSLHNNSIRLSTSWIQNATGTGRLSSQNPNLQNIPKEATQLFGASTQSENAPIECCIRSAFVSRPGYVFVAADYEQIELRILACLSNDKYLREYFEPSKQKQHKFDVFVELAAKWLRRDEASITPHDRTLAKRLVYGIIYGIGNEALAQQLNCSQTKAAAQKNSFLDSFPDIRQFITAAHQLAATHGVVTTVLGRRRPLPDIRSADPGSQARAKRQAVNTMIQGSAADLVKVAMVKAKLALQSHPSQLDATLLLQIHDELVWEVKDEQVDEFARLVLPALERCFSAILPLPFAVKLQSGKCWATLQSLKVDR
eukprot:c15609_g1_i3.p1 GENE.c15609_g1_i3~~c15609_g1_i3.p1  ORF type:complete len:529 (-),score=107.41 c15609_g1_i3:90-1676(-)